MYIVVRLWAYGTANVLGCVEATVKKFTINNITSNNYYYYTSDSI